MGSEKNENSRAGRHSLSPLETQEWGVDMADDGGPACQHLQAHSRIDALHDPCEKDRDDPLEQVEKEPDRSRPRTERARQVGRADVAASLSAYVNAAQEALPQAVIVVDRFHVARIYRAGADAVRKREFKRLKQTLAKPEYALLKGVMWPFRKRPADLQPAEKTQLNRLFIYSPQLEQAYTLREQLTDIFDDDHTKETATTAIQAWCQRVRTRQIREFDACLTTLDNWLDEITNYFLERQTSGFVEGFNNRIKVLKRRCYGIFDVKRLFQRLTLDVNGYERFAT